MHKSRNAAIGFIFVTMMIDIIGLGLIIPVLPKLIEGLTHTGISAAAKYGGWLTATYAIMQFLFAPILGRLSDQYGRRPVLLISIFGMAVDYIILFFAPSIVWLFIGRALSGIMGASFTTATAYIADISTPENRAKNFGMTGAAFGLGFIIGPGLGGLLGSFGPRIPFLVAAILSALNWLYGYFVLPESLDKTHRRKFSWSSAVPGRSLISLKNFPALTGLMIAYFFIYLGAHAVNSNWSFFTIEKFGWNEKMIGLSLSVVGVLVAFVQGWLIRVVNPKLGNEKSVYIGFLLYAAGMFLFAFATETWMMFAFMVPYCLGGIGGPALQSIISGNVPPNQQGELQGALTSLVSITSIFGPMVMTGIFAYFTGTKSPIHFSGAAFILGGILMLLAAIVAYFALHSGKHLQVEAKHQG